MAVHIVTDPTSGVVGSGPVIADRPLYADEAGNLVEAGDEAAHSLVVSHAGKAIDPALVESMNLALEGGKVKQLKAGSDKELHAGSDKDATPPDADGEAGAPIIAAGAAEVGAMNVAQLKSVAKDRKVPGYSSMSKEELVAAIVEGGAMQAGGVQPDA